MPCAESLSAHIFNAFVPSFSKRRGGIFTFQELQAKVKRAKEALIDYAYLVTLGAMIAVIAATALYTDQLHRKENVQAAAPAPEINSTPTASPKTTPTASPLPTLAPLRSGLKANAVRPVSGEVIRGFSDQQVFWETLACWQTHPALDIEAASGEEVLCLRDGVVTACSRDVLWGWRVQVRQTDERVCEYAGLLLCQVVVGQSVTRGQTLGTLMDAIPAEKELGTHLHLTLLENGEAIDAREEVP